MALDVEPIIDAVASHAAQLGSFDRVMEHEPINPPGNGVTGACWIAGFRPAKKWSGLASTSVLLLMTFRVYKLAQSEPADRIDPVMMGAVQDMANAVTGNFTLGGLVAAVDLLGMEGTPLDGKSGFLDAGEGAVYRVYDITIPLIIADVWSQSP